MLRQLEEVLRDLRRAAHFPVQHHERPRALGVERAAVQQIGQGPDSGQTVVEGVQHVGGALVEHHMLHFRRGEALRRGWGHHGRRGGIARRAGPTDERTEEHPDERTEGERNPESHGAPI